MSPSIDLSSYANLINPEHYDEAHLLSLPWFENCSFESDEWDLRCEKNTEKRWVLKLANDPVGEGGELLGDNPSLLRAVKLFLVIGWAAKGKSLGVRITTPEGVYNAYLVVISLIRYLKYAHGINNLSSINGAVAESLKLDYLNKTTEQRLNVEDRAIEAIEALFLDAERLATYKVVRAGRNNAKPDFDHTRFCADLGLSMRATQSCKKYQQLCLKLLDINGFSYKRNQSKNTGKGATKTTRTQDSIRKPLSTVKGFFKTIYMFQSVFPKSQRISEAWLSGVNVVKVSAKSATAKRGKTRDIPRTVFYKLMDEAIRWVLDYSDDLFEYQDLAMAQYDLFRTEGKYNVKKKGTKANKAHYASKQMSEWFKQNQPSAFPYSINSIERSQTSKENGIDITKVNQAKALRENGLTMQQIADVMKTYKGTVSRWVRWVPPLNGVSLTKVVNKHLVSACLLVLFAFTGRRKEEVMGLDAGCTEEQNGSYFIYVDQVKKNQGERGLPTIKLVLKAVGILEKLSCKAREISGSSKLLKLTTVVQQTSQDAWPDFNDFCEYTGIESVDEHGHYYSFADHQFRRFLAMTYWYRYPDPDLPTLSWFLGHESIAMTMEYITDEDGQWALRSVKNERIIDLVEEEFKAGASIVGDELANLFGQIDAESGSRAKRMERKGDLVDRYVLNFVPDGACFGNTKALKYRSKCLESEEVQLSSASCGSCYGCPNLIPVTQPMTQERFRDLTITQSPMMAACRRQAHQHV